MILKPAKASDPCLNRYFSVKIMLLLLWCRMLSAVFAAASASFMTLVFFPSVSSVIFFFFVFICWSSNCITLTDLLNWLIHKTAPPGNNQQILAYITGIMLECYSSWSFHWFGSASCHFFKLFVGLLVTGRATRDKCIFIRIYTHTRTCCMHVILGIGFLYVWT